MRTSVYWAFLTLLSLFFFFFNDTATTEIYTLSLHDALPISAALAREHGQKCCDHGKPKRSEEHTSELQSRPHLVCRLLLEKKKKKQRNILNNKKKKITKIINKYKNPT